MLFSGVLPDRSPGFTFAGQHSGSLYVWLVKSKFLLMPPTRDRFDSIPGRHGEYDFGFDFDTRTIELECVIQAWSEAELRQRARQVARWLDPSQGPQRLIFDSEPDKYYLVRYAGSADIEMVARQGKFTIPFRALDPFAYAVEKKEIQWPALYGDTTTLVNEGSAECPLVITIEAPNETNPIYPAVGIGSTNYGVAGEVAQTAGVTLTVGGVSVTYSGTITVHDKVVIDSGNFTVTKNGQNAIQYWLGDFPMLSPGSVEVAEIDTAGVGAKVTFSYRERWL